MLPLTITARGFPSSFSILTSEASPHKAASLWDKPLSTSKSRLPQPWLHYQILGDRWASIQSRVREQLALRLLVLNIRQCVLEMAGKTECHVQVQSLLIRSVIWLISRPFALKECFNWIVKAKHLTWQFLIIISSVHDDDYPESLYSTAQGAVSTSIITQTVCGAPLL